MWRFILDDPYQYKDAELEDLGELVAHGVLHDESLGLGHLTGGKIEHLFAGPNIYINDNKN